MPSYDYTDHVPGNLRDRYPADADIAGAAAWRELASRPERMPLLRALQREPPRRLARPCLFVSHRRADTARAQALAALARSHGVDTWVDVEDPMLSTLVAADAVTTACIIEMALLNCSHVLALLTVHFAGSSWIPYEYGRVKDRRAVTSDQAACLIEPGAATPPAEYFCLGEELAAEPDLSAWLRRERAKWSVAPPLLR